MGNEGSVIGYKHRHYYSHLDRIISDESSRTYKPVLQAPSKGPPGCRDPVLHFEHLLGAALLLLGCHREAFTTTRLSFPPFHELLAECTTERTIVRRHPCGSFGRRTFSAPHLIRWIGTSTTFSIDSVVAPRTVSRLFVSGVLFTSRWILEAAKKEMLLEIAVRQVSLLR